jgi:ABC-type transport system involved in cytochrome c biogenesis permease subunit
LVLPSLEQSERINRGSITLAFPLLTFGLLIGMVLSLAAGTEGNESLAHTLGWTDPKVISALAMWLVFAVLLHARFRPAMRGKSVMVLTIVAFGFLVFTWVGVEALRLPTAHGPPKTPVGMTRP